MITRRLYHADSYLRRFDAVVVAHGSWKGRPALVLDQTAFYPEAGGQLGDRGTIHGLAVVDTQQDDATILHLVDGELPAIHTTVTGELDWARRRRHMVQHTAQHVLSGALLDRAAAATVSARLGETALTIDVARDRLPDAELAAAEDLANDIVDRDLAIRAWFPTADELAQLRLRRDPKVTEHIRLVAIGDFDHSPCGGTHVARSAELAMLRVTASERYKGMTRVTFVAGSGGRSELFARDAILRGLATAFSCGPAEVPAAIDKLRRDAVTGSGELTAVRGRLASLIIAQLPSTGPAIAELPGDPDLLRTVAAKLVAAGRDALLAASETPEPGSTTVVLFRASGSSLDCAAVWKRLVARFGGRGGGKADRAEGRLASTITDWRSAVQMELDGATAGA